MVLSGRRRAGAAPPSCARLLLLRLLGGHSGREWRERRSSGSGGRPGPGRWGRSGAAGQALIEGRPTVMVSGATGSPSARDGALTGDRPRPLLVLHGLEDLRDVVSDVGMDARGVGARFARGEGRGGVGDEAEVGALGEEGVGEDDEAGGVVAPLELEAAAGRVLVVVQQLHQVFGFERGAELAEQDDAGLVHGGGG